VPPAERAAGLERMPEDLQEIAKARLRQWDLIPPPLQKEFLTNDATLQHFVRVDFANNPVATPRQQMIAEQFDQWFKFTPTEQKQMLGPLSAAERAQMEKTLAAFGKLSPQQRALCVRNYATFAGMSAAERAEFLKNAESWSKMSPTERQTWRDLVTHVPLWPPMPPATVSPAIIPPPLRGPQKHLHNSMATN